MNDPYDSHLTDVWNILDDPNEGVSDLPMRKPNRRRQPGAKQRKDRRRDGTTSRGKRERVEAADGTFRCRKCKTMVGPPISGGRHRNHCPLCLYSRHVDRSRPGDRLSDCRSMMLPIGLFTRRDGEQMLVHECPGCGVVRHNRVAADDSTVATMRLPVIAAAERVETDSRADRPA